MRKQLQVLTLIAALGISGMADLAQAALVDRGGGLIYDDDLNITWLADANYYAMTSGFNVDGRMTWNNAMTWASSLSYYDSVRNVTYTDWRLPTSDTCGGVNCTGSEMGHLFYTELGGVAGTSIATTHNTNYNLFQNVQSYYYWSGAEYAPDTDYAWLFGFNYGFHFADNKNFDYFAWAVHPGDVGASAVPVPAAVWLFGSGLIGLAAVARRRHRSAP